MSRPQKLNNVRKSSLVKHLVRKSITDSYETHRPTPLSKTELGEVLAKRPRVDFLDPFMRYAAMQARGVSLCAFLVTLAAFQRGLKVTFHYERASFDQRFAKSKMQGHRGEIFSISNGHRTHVFNRTLGDLTSPAANAIVEDKHLTKTVLKSAGVHTPAGIIVDSGQTPLIEKFLSHHSGKRFVVKPYNGSMGQGVHTNLLAEQVLEIIAQLKNVRILVEEHIHGEEFRALVVDERCVAIYRRHGAYVVGDGRSSIRNLIEEKNKIRKINPNLEAKLIRIDASVISFLARSDLTLDTVPSEEQKISLSGAANIALGGDPLEVTAEANPILTEVAQQACSAIGIPIAGLDLILKHDEGQELCYVLEMNQRPHIGSHSFPLDGPGQGNCVAEAIIDYYFPETVGSCTHPQLAYDFGPIRAALGSAQISNISLPVITPDWRVLSLHETGVAAKPMAQLIETVARVAGVFLMSVPRGNLGVELRLAYSPENWIAFINAMPAQFRPRFQKLGAEVANRKPRNSTSALNPGKNIPCND
jgi:D-alanine-D-alanine ligase-like ATP-grasp enzyme